ncbi:MAG: hypothetical protein JXA87_03430 [Thermoleophilia bacterium]|nr:hypothetical protein [Thermoleophilia bacterium]
MTDWDLEPTPSKESAAPGKPQGGAASGGRLDAAAGPDGVADRRAAPAAPKAFSGAIIMPGTATPEETVGASGASARRRRAARDMWGWIAAALALLVVGALIGFFVARSQSDQMEADLAQTREQLGLAQRALAQSEERNWNYYRENLALEAALEEAEAGGQSPTSTTVEEHAGYVADGIYLVGEDIPPGTYDGVVVGEQGYWARLKGTDGLVSQIIANGVPKGPFVLTIVESDKAVELRGVGLILR